MKKIKRFFAHKIFRILKWAFLILISAYLILVIFRVFHFINLDKTNAQVEKIHNTKITIDDVMGKNLPPDPGIEADKTVKGIDTNENGIRDDVELAIFKKYPKSAKTRAGLLQYALAKQMQLTQPFVNEVIATEVIREHSRASNCITKIIPKDNSGSIKQFYNKYLFLTEFVENLQFNTKERKDTSNSFFNQIGSYSDLDIEFCDIDYFKLPN